MSITTATRLKMICFGQGSATTLRISGIRSHSIVWIFRSIRRARAIAETVQTLLGWNEKPTAPPPNFRRGVQAQQFLDIRSAITERQDYPLSC